MGGTDGDRRVPEATFSSLAHEVRLDILRAFFEGFEPADPASMSALKAERRKSYSELMAAVGMEDSGKFNYHLERLRGVYVERVDGEYVPTAGAVALYRAVVAHRPTEASPDDLAIESPCPTCGAALRGRYEQEYLSVTCPDCDDFWGVTYPFPKNGLAARESEAAVDAVYDRLVHHVGLARTGQCPSCAGVVSITVPRDRLDGESAPTVEMTCEDCTWLVTVDVLTALRFDPRVASALVEIGVAGRARHDGQGSAEETPDLTGRVRSPSPFRAAVEIAASGDVATVVVDDDLTVESVAVE